VGMTISVRTRQDVVVADPERFFAAARQAYRDVRPEATEADAIAAVQDVHDAVHALIERDGGLVADDPAPGWMRPPVPDRSDGLSPAGLLRQVVLDEQPTLRDYGCFLPEDPFALRQA
jgi:hypothetical protein